MRSLLVILASLFVTGCSVVGQNNVESAPYSLISSDESMKIEVRHYDSMILVSADMSRENGYKAFRKLFDYIAGENEGSTEIAMTAPVIMDDKNAKDNATQGTEISMTAPVFMNDSADSPDTSVMSFVMPASFTLQNTPKPSDPDLRVSEINDYRVAAIQFNGTLNDSNVDKHTKLLTTWINAKGYTIIGKPVKAGYNGPLTIPFWRRNEILIEIN